jgi:FAD dependent oxidoreductase/Protein of unknown function (DUF3147)
MTRWHEYLIRFVLGGLVTAATGAIASEFGPETGGLFLAFPAIFCASATLIEKARARAQGKDRRSRHAAWQRGGGPGRCRCRPGKFRTSCFWRCDLAARSRFVMVGFTSGLGGLVCRLCALMDCPKMCGEVLLRIPSIGLARSATHSEHSSHGTVVLGEEGSAMNVAEEKTKSLWMETVVAEAPALDGDQIADVVVIGSGIAGLSTAYELTGRGRSVIVLDRARIGSGMTARTTAHLASALDDCYARLIDARGAEIARMVYHSQAAAIDRIEAIQANEQIACDFQRVDGFLLLAPRTRPPIWMRSLEPARKSE